MSQNQDNSGKIPQEARRIGPVDGEKALGGSNIGPGRAESRAILVWGAVANLPVSHDHPSIVVENVLSSNRHDKRAERDPLMDR